MSATTCHEVPVGGGGRDVASLPPEALRPTYSARLPPSLSEYATCPRPPPQSGCESVKMQQQAKTLSDGCSTARRGPLDEQWGCSAMHTVSRLHCCLLQQHVQAGQGTPGPAPCHCSGTASAVIRGCSRSRCLCRMLASTPTKRASASSPTSSCSVIVGKHGCKIQPSGRTSWCVIVLQLSTQYGDTVCEMAHAAVHGARCLASAQHLGQAGRAT